MPALPTEVGRGFYLVMFLIMVAILVAGFSQTVPGDFGSPGVPLLLHVHGAVFTCWVAMMIAQPGLVVAGDVRRHMQLGVLGLVLAPAKVVLAAAATLFSIGHNLVPPFFPKPAFLVLNLAEAVVFAGLFAAAYLRRREPEWHKRLMYCACVAIVSPGLGRFLPMDRLGAAGPLVMFAVVDLVLIAGPVADLLVRKRVHPAYVWGVSVLLLMEVAIGPLTAMPATAWAVKALGG